MKKQEIIERAKEIARRLFNVTQSASSLGPRDALSSGVCQAYDDLHRLISDMEN